MQMVSQGLGHAFIIGGIVTYDSKQFVFERELNEKLLHNFCQVLATVWPYQFFKVQDSFSVLEGFCKVMTRSLRI